MAFNANLCWDFRLLVGKNDKTDVFLIEDIRPGMQTFTTNLKALRKHHGWSQQAMADQLDIPRSTLSGYEQGYAEPDLNLIIQMADLLQVELDTLLKAEIKEGAVEDFINQQYRVLTLTVDEAGRNGIQLVDTKAEAGYLESFNDPEYIKDLPRIYFPQLPKGNLRAFEINGDSMLPMEPGSVVIASFVERLEDVKDGRTYIVATQEGLVYKRLRHVPDTNALSLISDNEVYPPYQLEYADIREIWQYQAHLSFSDGKAQFDAMLDDRLQDMHQKINGIYRKYVGGSLGEQ